MKFFGRKTQKRKKRLFVCLCTEKNSGKTVVESFMERSGGKLTYDFFNGAEHDLQVRHCNHFSDLKIINIIELDELTAGKTQRTGEIVNRNYHDEGDNISKTVRMLISLGFSICFWIGIFIGFSLAYLSRLQD